MAETTHEPPARILHGKPYAEAIRAEVAAGVERLKAERGFTDNDIGRIHSPIGLDIGSVSPAEIAVAIIGEITQKLRQEPA